jgi:uncharacterized protein YecE (DUF72 family)
MSEIRIGCSGFTYPHWKGVFYPPDVPSARWLEYYCQHFATVEMNNSFYRMPRPENCVNWRQRTPEGFVYSVKMHRVLTHRRRLMEPQRTLEPFLRALAGLGEKLGPVLVQLPPRWRRDIPRLSEFLDACREYRRVSRWAVEFRDADWLADDTYDLLHRHNASLVLHDNIKDHPRVLTADWLYVRYHGGQWGDYPAPYLAQQAAWLSSVAAGGCDVYAYYNNDQNGWAVKNALQLKSDLARRPRRRSA